MKAIYDSLMKDQIGKGLQLKSQDELVDRNNTFKPRVRRNNMNLTQSRRASSTIEEQFFEASDVDMQSALGLREEYVESVNNLNKVFSERISHLNKSVTDGKVSSNVKTKAKLESEVETEGEEVWNANKKRVMVVQKGREGSDSE
jgi:hypothetical protein